MKFHPVADIFPLLYGQAFEDLVADIREHGQREPIWLHRDRRIIDGRNRANACTRLGIDPRTQTYIGPDEHLVEFVVSLNLHRRHMTSDQRAACAVTALTHEHQRARERQGARTDLDPNIPQKIAGSGEAAEIVAKQFGTNRTYVRDAANWRPRTTHPLRR